MYRFFTFFVLIALFNVSVFSQNFNVSEVDATNFPRVKATFSAFDFQGKPYTNLTANDFTVRDNGFLINPALVNIECTIDAPYNVVIVIDKSSSMKDEVEGEIKWNWAKEGVVEFVNNIPLGDSSRMALTSFAGRADILCNFTQSKKEILDSLNKIPDIYGSTNFNVAFLDPVAGAINMLKNQNPNYKRAIVFLSDGEHSNLNGSFQFDVVTKLLREYNIQVFAITLLSKKNSDLETMAKRTGGYYDFVNSKTQLKDLYKNFASQLQTRQLCNLTWQNPDICDDFGKYRNASIRFNTLGITANKIYQAPDYSIVSVESDNSMYDFGNPEIGNYEEREVIITPRIKNFTAKNIKIVPDDYFEIIDWGDGIGNLPNYDFIMPVDVPRTLKVRFTPQVAKKFRRATLIFEGEPCPKEVVLIGGYHKIDITKPAQNDFASQCDELDIVWNGNEPEALLDLFYSIDNGVNWDTIATGITGYSYKWKSPVASDDFRIKVQSTPRFEYDFAHSFGGVEDDIVTSLCVTNNGLYHFVTGYFSGELNIGGTKLISKGKEDIFLAKFDNEGNFIWAKSAGSLNFNDRAYGIVSDHNGYVYITGVAYDGIAFDNSSPQLSKSNVPYFFVAKYNPSGQYVNSRFIGATNEYYDFLTSGIKIGFEYLLGSQPKIMVEGLYTGEYTEYNLNVYLPMTLTESSFTVAMNTNLELTEMYMGKKNWDYTSKDANYNSESFYKTDSFVSNFKIDIFDLTSKGKNDFWISKNSKVAQSIDISGKFSLMKQEPNLTNNKHNFGEVVYGDSVTSKLIKRLYNPYKVPIEITGYEFRSADGTDYYLDYNLTTDITGRKINPYDSIDLEIEFKPNYTGPRNAWLDIKSSCSDNVKLELFGIGVCGGSSLALYDFGNQNLKKPRKDTIECAFQNVSNVKLIIEPLVRGLNFSDFILEIPDKYEVYNGKIVVEAGQCIDLIITFNPTAIGDRAANVNFNVQKPCKNSIMELRGVGISADVSISSYDWGERRVNGIYPTKLQITNNSNGKEIIDSIKFVDPIYDNFFNININKGDYPKSIDANSTIEIDIDYAPTLEQVDFAEVYCYINSRVDPIKAKLDGVGILPKMIAKWDCGTEINIGDSTISTLTIENPSQSAVLKINEINFENAMEEFRFINPNDILSRIVDKGETINIPVMYKPKANSTNSNVINIYADDYDGKFTEEWKLSKVDANCDGVQLVYDNMDFGSTVICSNNQSNLIIKNTSKTKEVTLFLSQATFSKNSDLFKLENLSDIVVTGGKEVTIPISFQSKELGDFTAKLSIPNSANFNVELEIKASAINYIPTSDLKSANFNVADIFNYSIDLKLPQLESGNIDNVKLVIKFDPFVIQYKENSLKSTLNNWNWTAKYLGNGELEITGNGILNDNQTIKAFTIDFVVLLNDKHKTDISATTIFDCAEFDYDLSVINSNLVCFNDNRIVLKMSGSQFTLKDITPNPIIESTKIEFGVGFEVNVKIDILDMKGELIETLINYILPPGYFEAILNTAKTRSGFYFVKMTAGPYSEIKKILIVK